MDYALKYRLFPDSQQREQLDWVRDTVRQLYNHSLHRYNRIPETEGTVKQRVTQVRDEIPDLKDWWTDLTNIYSTVLQQAVEQIATNIENLGKLKQKGYSVGSLNWKAPHEYRSFTYRQRGFELDEKSGPNGRGLLTLKKVNGENIDVPIRLHRPLPDDGDVKHVTVKKDRTGAWYACLNIEEGAPEKLERDEIDTEDTVGLDLGITNFIHDSDGRQISRLAYPVTEIGWNASNGSSPGKNTGRTTGKNSDRRWLKCISGWGRRNWTSSIRLRRSTPRSMMPCSLRI